MAWTDDRVEVLKKLWAEGLSASQIAARLGGDEHLGTGHALGIGQVAVLALNQVLAQRHHAQDADETAAHGEQRHLRPARLGAPQEQRRHREQHA